MRCAQKVRSHGLVFRMNPVITVQQRPQYIGWPAPPARPSERRVSERISRFARRPCLQQESDSLRAAKKRRPVQGRFTSGPCIPHEGTGLRPGDRRSIRISSGAKENLHNKVVTETILVGQRRVQGCLPCHWVDETRRSSVLEKKLAKLPVAVKGGAIEATIGTQRVQRLPRFKHHPASRDVAKLSAPPKQVCPVLANIVYAEIKDEIGSSILDSSKNCRSCHRCHLTVALSGAHPGV